MHYQDTGAPGNLITIPFIKKDDPWYVVPAGQPGPAPYTSLVGPDGDNRARVTHDFVGGQIDWNVADSVTLSYIPGYTYANNDRFFTLGSVNAPGFNLAFEVNHRINQLTQELKVIGDSGLLSWVGGAYWYHSQEFIAFLFPKIPTSYAPFQFMPYYLASGWAGYGNVTLKATDRLRFSAGARYSSDSKHGIGATNFNSPTVADFEAGTPGVGYDFANRWTHPDWRGGIEFDLTPSTLLYGNVQTGYLPGAFNNDLPAGSTHDQLNVLPVDLLAYSGGIKSSFLGDALRINDEIYYYDYKNFQAGVYDGSDSSTTVFNARKTQIYGNEVTIRYRVTPVDQLSASIGYLHARYRDFVVDTFIHGGPLQLNVNGFQAYMSPDWTGSLGYSHTFNLASGGSITGLVNSFLSTSYWALFDHNPGSQQKSYTKTYVSLVYHSPDDRWSLGLWAKNLENAATISNTGNGGAAGTNVGYIDAPRTFGARFSYQLSMDK
jgi:iron complex outermembrane receptor protein